jgi:rare lipoprotein A (peptidoglycan hydrolase)
LKTIAALIFLLPFATREKSINFGKLIQAEKSDTLIEKPEDSFQVYEEKTRATYYHKKFNGRKTASGSVFSNSKFTAAHNQLPFGTKIRVTNIKNGKSVNVVVTDRGKMGKGITLDLTSIAFQKIQLLNVGRVEIKIETLKTSYKPNFKDCPAEHNVCQYN